MALRRSISSTLLSQESASRGWPILMHRSAEHLAPLLLHVELDLGALERALDSLEEGFLKLGEVTSVVRCWR